MRRKILRQTDVEIIEQDQLIKKEIEDGIIPDPYAPVEQEIEGQPSSEMDLGAPVMEPDLERDSRDVQSPSIPKGGEI